MDGNLSVYAPGRNTQFPGNSRTVPKENQERVRISLGMSARGSTHRVCCLDGNRLLPNQIPTYIAVKMKELFIGEKSQKRNKKEFVGRGSWAVASSGGGGGLVPRGPGPSCRFSSFSCVWGGGGGGRRPVGGRDDPWVVLPRGPPWLSTPLLATVAGYGYIKSLH